MGAPEGDTDLDTVLVEGSALYKEANYVIQQVRQQDEFSPPGLSIKTKTGLLIGLALVFASGGSGLYLTRRAQANKYDDIHENHNLAKNSNVTNVIPEGMNDEVSFRPAARLRHDRAKSSISNFKKNHLKLKHYKAAKKTNELHNDETTVLTSPIHIFRADLHPDCQHELIAERCERTYHNIPPDNNAGTLPQIIVKNKRTFCYCPLPDKDAKRTTAVPSSGIKSMAPEASALVAPPPAIVVNIRENDDPVIKRCRNRLLGYINAYINVPPNADNKQLAKLLLTLISKNVLHEAYVAKIYLYGTGLFGERDYETMNTDVQHQLAADLLARLVYGKSLEDHLIHEFSINRYTSITDYRTKIMNDSVLFPQGKIPDEISYYYNKYIVPDMPSLNLELNRYSNILVGSITWFMIYLTSEFSDPNTLKNKEDSAIENGIRVLNLFINGNLYQGSEYKIMQGLKFTGLFLDASLTPETLPDFNGLWRVFATEFGKYIEYSHNIYLKIKDIVSIANKVNNKPWFSEYEFANDMLEKFCKTENPKLYFVRNMRKLFISKEEFIDSVHEQAWCDIINDNDMLFRIKIPTIKNKFINLRREYFDMVIKSSQLFIESSLTKSDFFNPYLDPDDFVFIEKAALEAVVVKLNEYRHPQERLIGPPLKKFETKEKYFFFRASLYGEQRVYALDSTHKEPIQRIRVGSKDILQKVSVFFKDEYFYPSPGLKLSIAFDLASNITISEQDPIQLFIKKIGIQKEKEFDDFIKRTNMELSPLHVDIYEVSKELLIPFYSCVTALQGENATDAFVSCLMDGIFLVFPIGKKALSTIQKVSDRLIGLSFMIKKNKVFIKDGKILWKKISADLYIYNTILNERSMLKSSVVNLLIGSLDPGFGLLKEIKKIVTNTAIVIMKGGAIHAYLFSMGNINKLLEVVIRTKSINDSAKKIFMKASRSSGRLGTRHLPDDKNTTDYMLVQEQSYQLGEYYLYHMSSNNTDMILGVTDEVTDKGGNIYVVLGGDELNGVMFRCICGEDTESACNIIHWLSYEMFAEKILPATLNNNHEAIFEVGKKNHVVYYPGYHCVLFEDGLEANKTLTMIKIDHVHYLYYPEEQQLRLLYDGDLVEVTPITPGERVFNINRDPNGRLVISQGVLTNNTIQQSVFNSLYSYYGYFPVVLDDAGYHVQSLHYLSDRLFLNVHGRYFKLDLTVIRNQFLINSSGGELPAFIVALDSLSNRFAAAKPFLKKHSPHIGMTLEGVLVNDCDGKIKQFPTLLINGAISSGFNIKLRSKNSYYSLGEPINQFFPLRCDSDPLHKLYWLQYDLFTESFELVSNVTSLRPPVSPVKSHYDDLLDHFFSVEKFPNILDIISINSHQRDHQLAMRLLQAAFLRRLNPVDRLETLQLPLVQVYSWKLHQDVRDFQRKYPAAALWMTWQRQLQPLLKKGFLSTLPLIRKVRLQNNNKESYSDGLLVVGYHTPYEAVWVYNDKSKEPLILQSAEKIINDAFPDIETEDIYWLPKADHMIPLTVTQFMYEKNIFPKVTYDTEKSLIYITNSYIGDGYLGAHSVTRAIEYIVISPNGKWVATIDDQRNLQAYHLLEKYSYKEDPRGETLINPVLSTKLDAAVGDNYALCVINNDGAFYYPRGSLWVENAGHAVFWSPPLNYSPAFISQDQRFLGYKHNDNNNVIIYDQKRKLMRTLNPVFSQNHKEKIISVAFSALNAVVALAFDDGHVYLYDLILEQKKYNLEPISHIRLNNYMMGAPSHNILMRFEDFFETLTIIHAEKVDFYESSDSEVIYVRSSYSFNLME